MRSQSASNSTPLDAASSSSVTPQAGASGSSRVSPVSISGGSSTSKPGPARVRVLTTLPSAPSSVFVLSKRHTKPKSNSTSPILLTTTGSEAPKSYLRPNPDAPTPAYAIDPVSPRLDPREIQRISRRWEVWRVLTVFKANQASPSNLVVRDLKVLEREEAHKTRCVKLLRAGVEWNAIVDNDYDDMNLDDGMWEEWSEWLIARSQREKKKKQVQEQNKKRRKNIRTKGF